MCASRADCISATYRVPAEEASAVCPGTSRAVECKRSTSRRVCGVSEAMRACMPLDAGPMVEGDALPVRGSLLLHVVTATGDALDEPIGFQYPECLADGLP